MPAAICRAPPFNGKTKIRPEMLYPLPVYLVRASFPLQKVKSLSFTLTNEIQVKAA